MKRKFILFFLKHLVARLAIHSYAHYLPEHDARIFRKLCTLYKTHELTPEVLNELRQAALRMP